MTPEEMTDLIVEQESKIKALEDQNSKKDTEITALKAGGPKGGISEEQVKQLQEKATRADTLEKENEELKQGSIMKDLKDAYPQITDWSVIPKGTREQMEETAKKVAAMIGDKKPATPPNDDKGTPPPPAKPDDKGNAWRAVPGSGSPAAGPEATKEAEFKQHKKELNDAMKKGDISSVIDKCFELQPNATKHLFSGQE